MPNNKSFVNPAGKEPLETADKPEVMSLANRIIDEHIEAFKALAK